jgi:TetR/AcrR family transcriptional regulator, regulator of cefoperazone and chloramphenicol sensitivity
MKVAEKLFSEKGYAQTSIRDITAAAQCNLAAVNYHFGSKEKLYEEIFRQMMTRWRQERIQAVETVMAEADREDILEHLLRTFAFTFVGQMAGTQEHEQRLMNLFMREIMNPHLPREMFVREIAQPTERVLGQALTKICPPLSEMQIRACVHSFLGQLIHAGHVRRLLGEEKRSQAPFEGLKTFVEHIVRFTAAGIRDYMTPR